MGKRDASWYGTVAFYTRCRISQTSHKRSASFCQETLRTRVQVEAESEGGGGNRGCVTNLKERSLINSSRRRDIRKSLEFQYPILAFGSKVEKYYPNWAPALCWRTKLTPTNVYYGPALAGNDYWQKVGITLDRILGGWIPFEPENLFPWYNPDLPRSCNPNIETGKDGASYYDNKKGDIVSHMIMKKSTKPCSKRSAD